MFLRSAFSTGPWSVGWKGPFLVIGLEELNGLVRQNTSRHRKLEDKLTHVAVLLAWVESQLQSALIAHEFQSFSRLCLILVCRGSRGQTILRWTICFQSKSRALIYFWSHFFYMWSENVLLTVQFVCRQISDRFCDFRPTVYHVIFVRRRELSTLTYTVCTPKCQ